MDKKNQLLQQMANKVKCLDLLLLVEAFELTNSQNGSEIPTVRGVLMDELELRNSAAFEAWLNSACDSPRSFFLTV
jgi:hypothetical protein